MQFSLAFFSSDGAEYQDSKYHLLIDCAKFADLNGFTAVWTPERHFHEFGGIFPNPSLTGVLLAATTTRIRIRSGSIALPLHNPIRVAEEWAVVDNLSGGRVDLSFATGWHPNDFVLAPENFGPRLDLTFAGIETVRSLWRGNEFTGPNGLGQIISVKIHPLPLQKELPVWMTCTGTPERFIQAGRKGFNVLTALIFQTMDQLARRIEEYRAAREQGGHDPKGGTVTLMLHTFLGDDVAQVRKLVRTPLKQYLKSSLDLWKQENRELSKLREDSLEVAFLRYFTSSGLFGTVESCAQRVRSLKEIGVDEIACLIDFGVSAPLVAQSLECLATLQAQTRREVGAKLGADAGGVCAGTRCSAIPSGERSASSSRLESVLNTNPSVR